MRYLVSAIITLVLMVSVAWAGMPEYMDVLEVNEFEGVTFYAHTDYNVHPSLSGQLFPYVAVTDTGARALRFYSEYEGESWIFFDCVQFVVDGERYSYDVESWDKVTDVYNGGVSETVDYAVAITNASVDFALVEGMLMALLNAEVVKIRLDGKQGNYDSVLRDDQLTRLQETILAYKGVTLGGN